MNEHLASLNAQQRRAVEYGINRGWPSPGHRWRWVGQDDGWVPSRINTICCHHLPPHETRLKDDAAACRQENPYVAIERLGFMISLSCRVSQASGHRNPFSVK